MFEAWAGELKLADQPLVCVEALLNLVEIVESCPLGRQSDNVIPSEKSVSQEGDNHEANRAGPDPKRRLTGGQAPREDKPKSHSSHGRSVPSTDEGPESDRGGRR